MPGGREAGGGPRTAVVTVGDEVLLGDTIDTNAARVGQRMGVIGAPVVRRETVADEARAIQEAVSRGLAACELVVVTGGLGPTPDDLTREAVADLLGVSLRLDPEVAEELRARYRALGREHFPERNLVQAMVPEGARVLPNALGTAPGLALERDGRLVLLLPGVPRELEGLLDGPAADAVRDHFGDRLRPPFHRYLRTTGIPESGLSERVEALLPRERGPVRLAYLPSFLGVTLRFTVEGGVDAVEAAEWLDRMEGTLDDIAPYRYDGPDLAAAVGDELQRAGLTLATGESCTGGLVARRLTDRAGASRWFLGGVVAYANEAKAAHLGVPEALIRDEGAVSEAVAHAMATGAARAFGADAGVGVTGIAGPGGGTPEKPVGTVCYAAVVGERVRVERRRFPGSREAVRERSAQAALHLLYRVLRDLP